jgi:hypothetical protein
MLNHTRPEFGLFGEKSSFFYDDLKLTERPITISCISLSTRHRTECGLCDTEGERLSAQLHRGRVRLMSCHMIYDTAHIKHVQTIVRAPLANHCLETFTVIYSFPKNSFPKTVMFVW